MIMCIELSATTCPTSSGSLVSRRKIIGNQGRISKPTFNLFQTLWLADHKLFLALSRIVRSDFWKPVCLILDQHKDSNFSLELWDKSVGNRSRDISTQVVNISSTTYISSCNCVKLHLLLLSFFLKVYFYSVVDYLARHNILKILVVANLVGILQILHTKNVVSALCKVEGANFKFTPTPHPKATSINVSQPPTLYYLEPFPMERECSYPRSDGFRYHYCFHLIPSL